MTNETGGPASSRLAVLLFTDVVDSTRLKARVGTAVFAALLDRHNRIFEQSANSDGAHILKHTGDGFFAEFPTPSSAVRAALRFQRAMSAEPWPSEQSLTCRVGVHVGEVAVMSMAGRADVSGLAADLAARITALAGPGQILLTRNAFDDARQFVAEAPSIAGEPVPPLRWVAHGRYLFKGIDEPLEVFEVGLEGAAPLSPPTGSDSARRSVPHEQEPTLGWRPAIGMEVPQRRGWMLQRSLGAGGFGEVWLARHEKTQEQRVFKFCFDVDRLRSLKRELTLFRLLRDALGDRPDIARLYEVKLDEPPFFLESEWTEGGNLRDWSAAQGGLDRVPQAQRIDIVARLADAVAAAHGVGVLHKDIKPDNVLMHPNPDGSVQPRLSDFGIALLADPGQLAARQITAAGMTSISEDSSYTGTRIYMPPEQLAGKPFTTQGDVYALGILLYQMVTGDLAKPLAGGWEREVKDELLREDIAACTEGDPAQRLSSAAELARRLRRLPERRRECEAIRAQARMAQRWRQRRRLAVALGAALFMLSVIALLAYLREGSLRRRAESAELDQRHARELADRNLAESQLRARLNRILLARSASQQPDFPKAWQWLASVEPSPMSDEDWWFGAWECRRRSREIYELPLRPSLPSLRWYSARFEAAVQMHPERNRIVIQRRAPGRSPSPYATDLNVPTGRWELDWWSGARVEDGAYQEPPTPRFRQVARKDGNFMELLGDHDEVVWSEPVRQAGLSTAALSTDHKYAAIGQTNGVIRVFQIDRSPTQEIGVIRGYREEPLALAFGSLPPGTAKAGSNNSSSTAKVVLHAVTSDFVHRAWVIGPAPDVDEFKNAHQDTVRQFAFHPSGRYLASGGYDGQVKIWDLEKGIAFGPVLSFSAHPTSRLGVAQLLFDKAGERIFTSGFDGLVREWDWRDGRSLRQWQVELGRDQLRPNIALSQDERKIYISHGHVCERIDMTSGRAEATYGDGIWDVMSMLLMEQEGILILAHPSEDRAAGHFLCEIWDLASGKHVRDLIGHTAGVRSIALSPERDRVATSSSDGTAIIWDWRSGTILHRLDVHAGLAHTNDVPTVHFSPDPASDLIVTASHDYRVVLWSARSGRELAVVQVDEEADIPYGQTGALKDANFTIDGRKIAIGAKNDIRLLDLHFYDHLLESANQRRDPQKLESTRPAR